MLVVDTLRNVGHDVNQDQCQGFLHATFRDGVQALTGCGFAGGGGLRDRGGGGSEDGDGKGTA